MSFSDELNRIEREVQPPRDKYSEENELKRVLNDCRKWAEKGGKYIELEYDYDSYITGDSYSRYFDYELRRKKYGFTKVKVWKEDMYSQIPGESQRPVYRLHIFISWRENKHHERNINNNALEDEWDKIERIGTFFSNLQDKYEELIILHPVLEAIIPLLMIIAVIILIILLF